MTTETEIVTYPGARPPDRSRDVDSWGVRIHVNEWGDEGARPVLLAHGGPELLDEVLAAGLERFTPNTITSEHRLRQVLDEMVNEELNER